MFDQRRVDHVGNYGSPYQLISSEKGFQHCQLIDAVIGVGLPKNQYIYWQCWNLIQYKTYHLLIGNIGTLFLLAMLEPYSIHLLTMLEP